MANVSRFQMGSVWSKSPRYEDLQSEYDRQEHYWMKRMALQQAKLRDMLLWESLAVVTVTAPLFYWGQKHNNKFVMVPIIPLVMLLGYHHEKSSAAYLEQVRQSAEKILNDPNEARLLEPAGGRITLEELDRRVRAKQEAASSKPEE